MTEEHSEIVLREARITRPGTGDDPDEVPPTQRGVGLTVHDKSLRPSVLRWKSWEVSDGFREYAERAARGEKLPRFEGSILADPSRMLPMPSPDQSETSRRRAYGIKSPRPSLMNPNSLLWNPWLWAASATVFAVGLFSFTLWYTTPRDEVVWDTNALTPAQTAPAVIAPLSPRPSIDSRELAADEPSDTSAETRIIQPAAPASPPVPRATPPAPTAQRVAARPELAAPPLAAAAAPPVRAQPAPTAVAPLAKAAPVDRSATQLDGSLKGTATYPVPSEPLPVAAAPAPAASAVEEADPLLVEAPSF